MTTLQADKPPIDALDGDIRQMVQQISPQRIEADVRTLVAFGTRHTLSETKSDTRGIGAARRWLRQQFEKISAQTGGRLQVELDGYTQQPDGKRITRPVDIINVVAVLPGASEHAADRVYIISGHYDSICSDPTDHTCDAPGADDDASGVAAVLEAARVMAGQSFDATIIFAAVAGEEQGLFGSKYMAAKCKSGGMNVAGMFTNDIIGASVGPRGRSQAGAVRVFSEGVPESETEDQQKLRLASGSENDAPARQLARYVRAAAARYAPDFDVTLMFRRDRLARGGDHTSFSREGYPAIRFTEVHENYEHQHQNVRLEAGIQYGDLIQFCDFDYIANVTRVNVASLASLAHAPAVPANPRILVAKLTPDTTLRWDANGEPDLIGYEIVRRETTKPDWEHFDWVGNVTQHTIDLSKDNWFFGVRAVDAKGHRSPVGFAFPSKETP